MGHVAVQNIDGSLGGGLEDVALGTRQGPAGLGSEAKGWPRL